MKLNPAKSCGIIDHVFVGGGIQWDVYVRIIPNKAGSTTTWTFIRPDGLTDQEFEEQLKGFEAEIKGWKDAIEKL